MRPDHGWLKLLNVHHNEWRTVKRLFWLQFFQGAGISFFFTAEFARFLERFPIHQLPWVMVISAFLLWATGLVYTILEHLIPFKKFNVGLIVFMAASMLCIRVGSIVFPQDWFYYLSLSWFYVLYLLNNLEFWGIAAQLFDIRQSKRLFGVISAGDIPAKFIGYTLALVFVGFTGTLNLLLIGFVCMLASLPFFTKLADEEKESFAHDHGIVRHGRPSAAQSVRNLLHDFRKSHIIRRIAWISLMTSACMIIVNYGFYAKVKESNHTDVELARFIALFMASLRVTALITKTIFTGRLTMHLGVRSSLFITPVAMILLVGFILVFSMGNSNASLILYLFAATSIGVDVLRTAINAPVLLTVMQPLPLHERLRAHNIVKGIMDPFATLLSGVLLLVLFRVQGMIDLVTICYILLALAAGWIAGIVLVNKEYLHMLIKTISSRYFSQEEFNLNDPETFAMIREKIQSGSESEILSILMMVGTRQNPLSIELLESFLEHPSEAVKLEAIRLVGSKRIFSLREKLTQFLFDETTASVKAEAVKTICQLGDNALELEAYLDHPDAQVQQAAMMGLLGNQQGISKSSAAEKLQSLAQGNPTEKLAAIRIMDATRDTYSHSSHAALLSDADTGIRKKAIAAVGTAALAENIGVLATLFPSEEKRVLKAFQQIGSPALSKMTELLSKFEPGHPLRKQLWMVIGRIGGRGAQEILIKHLAGHPADQAEIIRALYKSRFRAGDGHRAILEETCRMQMKCAVELLHMQMALPPEAQSSLLLQRAIQIEMQEIRENILCLFACLYDRKQIKKVRNGLLTNNRNNIANAMEIIELTVRKDLGKVFNILYEKSPVERKCDQLHALNGNLHYRETADVLQRILSEKPIHYLDWTKACSLYATRKFQLTIDNQLMLKFLQAENPLLQETARYAYDNRQTFAG